MKLSELVNASNGVASAGARHDKVARLAALLAALEPDDIEVAILFLSGSMRQGKLGVGHAIINAARAAPESGEPSLDLREVDEALARVSAATGPGSNREKTRLLQALFSRTTAVERDFMVRLLYGELRQGALEGVLTDAVAQAAHVAAPAVRRAVMMAGDLASVARTVLTEGAQALHRFTVQVMQPLRPMLADSAESVDEALDALGDAALELKLDGARVQVHKAGGDVRVFSRQLNDVTSAVPETVELVRAMPVREVILDGEALALDGQGLPHPFQVTMRRFGRRLNVEALRQELPLSTVFFDCLYLDGAALVDEAQARRFDALESCVPAEAVVPHLRTGSRSAAASFLQKAREAGHEGIMVKSLEAPYAAGSRGQAWIKLKPARTLDLVVLAAEWGSGRRRGWLSNLHLGARDPERGAFVMLGKTFKGLTDQVLEWQTRELLAREIGRDDFTVYVRPELVVEIAFNEVQTSPHYPGGLTLRFARVRRYRDDKTAAEADTLATLRRLAPREAQG